MSLINRANKSFFEILWCLRHKYSQRCAPKSSWGIPFFQFLLHWSPIYLNLLSIGRCIGINKLIRIVNCQMIVTIFFNFVVCRPAVSNNYSFWCNIFLIRPIRVGASPLLSGHISSQSCPVCPSIIPKSNSLCSTVLCCFCVFLF
jgi:hypothetical protein